MKAAALVVALAPMAATSTAGAEPRLEWHDDWRRVGAPEYAITLTAGAGALWLGLLTEGPDEPSWSDPAPLDDEIRDALRFRSRPGRERAARVSDTLALASIVHPVLVDAVFVTWLGDSNPDVAWQMQVINAQAYSVGLLLNQATKRLTARARPYADECSRDGGYSSSCGSDRDNEAFYSGHSVTAATSAGLVCAHHTHVPLYGGGTADASACAAAVALTLGTGTLRIASDKHWASDVIVGGLAGYVGGYLMPTLLYYGDVRIAPRESAAAVRLTVVPTFDGERALLRAVGRF